MTDQEHQLIAGLAERIHNAPVPQIDRDASDLIQRTIGSRPDALYILVQTVLLQEMALNQTKAQLEDLKRQAGFLNTPPPQQYQAPQYQPQPNQAPPYQPPPPPSYGGGLSGFLHQAATTAAGVLAGEVAFDALAGLFGHHGGYGGGFFGGGGIVPGGETIVNNYYDDQGGMSGGIGGDGSRFSDAASASGDQMSPDIEDDRDNSGNAFSSGGDGSQDDSSGFDGGGDSGGDDGGGFDGGGGGDDGGGSF